MEATFIISIISSSGMIGSMLLNWVQYRHSKRGTDLNNFEKQLEILEKLQQLKDEKYQAALKTKDVEIQSLKEEVERLNKKLDKYTNRLIVLQNAVNTLIGGGCKRQGCQQRLPFPVDELGDILGLTDGE